MQVARMPMATIVFVANFSAAAAASTPPRNLPDLTLRTSGDVDRMEALRIECRIRGAAAPPLAFAGTSR